MQLSSAILTTFIVLIIVIAIETLLIMVIWNSVIIKKFPDANIKKLGFLDALAIIVFFSILFSPVIVYKGCTGKN